MTIVQYKSISWSLAAAAFVVVVASAGCSRVGSPFGPTQSTSVVAPVVTPVSDRLIAANWPSLIPALPRIDGSPVLPVVGFAAAATDLGALYREFVLRDGVVAGTLAAPRLVRSWRKVVETLRYPAASGDLPDAEVLAVAVSPAAAGAGLGARLVAAATDELGRRGVPAVKVVTGADNVAALRLYERCGFAARERVAVHEGVASEVLVWPSS